MKNIIIIGAGAAGLMAAQKLGEAGVKVAIYDAMKSPARKFLLAGRGGLNLTHSESMDYFLEQYNEAADFMEPLLQSFTPQDLRAWATDLGVETFIGTSGRVFPKSFKASPLLRAWLRHLNELGVEFHFQHELTSFKDKTFTFKNGVEVTSNYAVLAMGGGSWGKLGSNGAFVEILRANNIKVNDLQPANMGFEIPWTSYMIAHFGKPIKNCLFTAGGKSVMGETMITSTGLEGGAIYALSKVLREEINAKGEAKLTINFKPALLNNTIKQKLEGKASVSNRLKKLNLSLTEIALIQEVKGDLLTKIKGLELTLKGYSNIDKAISTAGGVALDELNKDLSLKKYPHIYIAGEMLDFEAPTGGYLLQGAFSSGVMAAKAINDRLLQPVQSQL